MSDEVITAEHLSRRVVYTDRDGKQWLGTVRGVVEGTPYVDISLDPPHPRHSCSRNHLPEDALTLVPLPLAEADEGVHS